ncbi:MAG: DUF3810 domain-containing protein [Mariniphaga sp.]
MKKNWYKKLRWWIVPVLAVVMLGLIKLLSRHPQIVERYYSQGVYPVLASFISFISKWFPFSLDDLFYFLLIVTGVSIVILSILRKISLRTSALVVLNVLAAGYILFYTLWGFNYFRSGINDRLEIASRASSSDEFMDVFRNLAQAANDSYTEFDDFNRGEVGHLIEASYRQLAPALKLEYPAGSRRAKPITLSGFFAQAGISGYFGPFFNEIHINRKLLPVEYPFVLAHEKAHQFGITGEAEANFYAWLVCINSPSKQLQYSANLVALRYFINHGFRQQGFKEVVSLLDERVVRDIRRIQAHWLSLRNEKVEAVAAKVNDAYLKTNQVEEGIQDYTGVVKHIMEFSLDSSFQRKAGF